MLGGLWCWSVGRQSRARGASRGGGVSERGEGVYVSRRMSDTQQGPGWWQASDGKWYPPQQAPPPPGFQQPAPSKKSGCGRAALIGVAVGLVVLVGCVAIVSNAADEVDDDIRERDAAEAQDVELNGCRTDDAGFMVADITVTNQSSERSNYGIEVTFEAPDGSQIETGFASVSALEPGQSTEQVAQSLTAPPGEFDCRVVDVTRFSDEP